MRGFNYLSTKWGVGPIRLFLILLTFTLTGLTVVRLKEPVMSVLLPGDSPGWLHWTIYLVVILPIYQVVLLTYGTLLGQFNFFWKKFMALRRRISGRSKD